MAEYRANRELRENCASAGFALLQLVLFLHREARHVRA
jgi:hypothetical protein